MKVLVVRHHEEDAPGLIGDAFTERGATVTTCLFPAGGPLPDPDEFDHVVVLGSKWSVYDDDAVGSWIEDELAWLRRAGSGPLPVLGICFGAQLLASAFGGRVEPSPVYELGWTLVEPVDAPVPALVAPVVEPVHAPVEVRVAAPGEVPVEPVRRDASPAGFPAIGRGPWFQFHGDCCVLPRSATVLARNDVCVQAFSVGRNLGVQFHPEIDAGQLQRWFDNGGRAAAERLGIDPDELLLQTKAEEPAAGHRAGSLVDAYLAFTAGVPGSL